MDKAHRDRLERNAIAELEKLMGSSDTEGAHMDADVVLLGLLGALGFDDVVKAWHQIDKWYSQPPAAIAANRRM